MKVRRRCRNELPPHARHGLELARLGPSPFSSRPPPPSRARGSTRTPTASRSSATTRSPTSRTGGRSKAALTSSTFGRMRGGSSPAPSTGPCSPADPDRYAPQFGGFCTGAMALRPPVPIDPEAWLIVEGRLYLHYDKEGTGQRPRPTRRPTSPPPQRVGSVGQDPLMRQPSMRRDVSRFWSDRLKRGCLIKGAGPASLGRASDARYHEAV